MTENSVLKSTGRQTKSFSTLSTVFCDTSLVFPWVNVGLEDERGAFEMTCHLLEKGHRRIAFLADNMEGVDYTRYVGHQKAMAKYGLLNHLKQRIHRKTSLPGDILPNCCKRRTNNPG